MKWIGLTGGIGSGKSTVAKALRSKGFAVLDADEMAKRAVMPGTPALAEIIQVFGREFVKSDGNLDRKRIGDLVFSDPSQLEKLEQIVHPYVQNLIKSERQLLNSQNHKFAFYDVPLLYEKALEHLFDAVIVVDCPEPLRILRVVQRDGLTEAEIKKRIANQRPLEEKVKKANYVIVNGGSVEELDRQVELFLTKLKSDFLDNLPTP